MNELEDYYQNLYGNQDSDENEEFKPGFLANDSIPTLSGHLKMMCEGALSCAECLEALKKVS